MSLILFAANNISEAYNSRSFFKINNFSKPATLQRPLKIPESNRQTKKFFQSPEKSRDSEGLKLTPTLGTKASSASKENISVFPDLQDIKNIPKIDLKDLNDKDKVEQVAETTFRNFLKEAKTYKVDPNNEAGITQEDFVKLVNSCQENFDTQIGLMKSKNITQTSALFEKLKTKEQEYLDNNLVIMNKLGLVEKKEYEKNKEEFIEHVEIVNFANFIYKSITINQTDWYKSATDKVRSIDEIVDSMKSLKTDEKNVKKTREDFFKNGLFEARQQTTDELNSPLDKYSMTEIFERAERVETLEIYQYVVEAVLGYDDPLRQNLIRNAFSVKDQQTKQFIDVLKILVVYFEKEEEFAILNQKLSDKSIKGMFIGNEIGSGVALTSIITTFIALVVLIVAWNPIFSNFIPEIGHGNTQLGTVDLNKIKTSQQALPLMHSSRSANTSSSDLAIKFTEEFNIYGIFLNPSAIGGNIDFSQEFAEFISRELSVSPQLFVQLSQVHNDKILLNLLAPQAEEFNRLDDFHSRMAGSIFRLKLLEALPDVLIAQLNDDLSPIESATLVNQKSKDILKFFGIDERTENIIEVTQRIKIYVNNAKRILEAEGRVTADSQTKVITIFKELGIDTFKKLNEFVANAIKNGQEKTLRDYIVYRPRNDPLLNQLDDFLTAATLDPGSLRGKTIIEIANIMEILQWVGDGENFSTISSDKLFELLKNFIVKNPLIAVQNNQEDLSQFLDEKLKDYRGTPIEKETLKVKIMLTQEQKQAQLKENRLREKLTESERRTLSSKTILKVVVEDPFYKIIATLFSRQIITIGLGFMVAKNLYDIVSNIIVRKSRITFHNTRKGNQENSIQTVVNMGAGIGYGLSVVIRAIPLTLLGLVLYDPKTIFGFGSLDYDFEPSIALIGVGFTISSLAVTAIDILLNNFSLRQLLYLAAVNGVRGIGVDLIQTFYRTIIDGILKRDIATGLDTQENISQITNMIDPTFWQRQQLNIMIVLLSSFDFVIRRTTAGVKLQSLISQKTGRLFKPVFRTLTPVFKGMAFILLSKNVAELFSLLIRGKYLEISSIEISSSQLNLVFFSLLLAEGVLGTLISPQIEDRINNQFRERQDIINENEKRITALENEKRVNRRQSLRRQTRVTEDE